MTTARAMARQMTDEDLVNAHTQAQKRIAYLIQIECLNLAGEHVRISRACAREILSRSKHSRVGA